MNRVTLIGRVGRDPEARTFSNGGRVVSFSLATSEVWRDKSSGERKEKTTWHNIVIFNEALGKIAEQYVKKGDQLCVEGQIDMRKYTDKDGAERTSYEIVLPRFGGHVELLGGKKDGDGEKAPGASWQAPSNAGGGFGSDIDDSIPF